MFNKKEKLLILTLAFIQFFHIVDFMIMMPLGPQLMRIFTASPQQFSILVSSYTFSAGASGLLAALFIDRFDRKFLLILTFLGFALGTLACALAPSYGVLVVTRSVTGAFGGVLGSLILAIISDTIDPQRRGTAMGYLMTSFSVASILGVPFSLYLANKFNWHAPFLFLGAFSLLLMPLIYNVVPNIKGHLLAGHLYSWKDPLLIFKNQSQLYSLAFMSFLILGQFTLIPFLSPSMVANAGMSESQLPLIYLIGGVCSIVTSPLIGRAADVYGKRNIFYLGVMISLIPIYLVTNLGPSSLFLNLFLMALFFTAIGARMVPAMAIATSTVLPKNRGSFMSISSSVQNFSSAVASTLAGMIVTQSPQGQLLNYDKVGFIAIIFSLLAVYLVSKVDSVDGKI